MLQNEKYVGATLSSSPARKLVRNLCASPDQYETVEMQSTDNNPTMGPVAAHRQPSSRRVRLAFATKRVASAKREITRASATGITGGESMMRTSKLRFRASKTSPARLLPRSSAGPGGTGPLG